jgi:beta-N-acetylhexosaminidase
MNKFKINIFAIFYIIIITAGILVISSCSDNDSVNAPILLDTNSLKLKIGQMILVGFRGMTIDENSTIAKDIQAGRVGGVILFDKDSELNIYNRNIQSPEQVAKLVADLKSFSSKPLFVAIDQEGGKVNRLKINYGFLPTVSQQYLGNLDNVDTTIKYARQTAETLSMLGININFAPVVDLNINPESPAIGKVERSFSIDPNIVVKHSQLIVDEHKKKNIACVLKHFPGHGSAGTDSHLGITDVTNTWQNTELEPYRHLINNTNIAVMTAHIFNSNLDADYPATLSKKIIDGILRQQIGFSGIVFSDDMNMSAISSFYGFENALLLSINAGVDVVVIANNLIYDEFIAEKAQQAIFKLVMDGKISVERIDEAYNKIINFKNILN